MVTFGYTSSTPTPTNGTANPAVFEATNRAAGHWIIDDYPGLCAGDEEIKETTVLSATSPDGTTSRDTYGDVTRKTIMLITLPVFLPLVAAHGFDPIWFGILFVVMMEISYMTPPFGFNLFYLRSVAPPEVTMKDIYWSVGPYTVVELTGLFIIVLFPQIALWLPNLIFSGR